MKLLFLILAASYAVFGADPTSPFDRKRFDDVIASIPTSGLAAPPQDFLELFSVVSDTSKRVPLSTDGATAIIDCTNSLRAIGHTKIGADHLKIIFDNILSHQAGKSRYSIFITIIGDEAKPEFVIKSHDSKYFGGYLCTTFIPAVADLLRPIPPKKKRNVSDLPAMSIQREDGESDESFNKRTADNDKKIALVGTNNNAELYQPVIEDLFKSWLRAANPDNQQMVKCQTAYDRIAGIGSWRKLMANK